MGFKVIAGAEYDVKPFNNSKEAFKDLLENRPDMITINTRRCPLHEQMALLLNIGAIQEGCRKKHKKIYRPVVIFM